MTGAVESAVVWNMDMDMRGHRRRTISWATLLAYS